jgi:hypothetical protein
MGRRCDGARAILSLEEVTLGTSGNAEQIIISRIRNMGTGPLYVGGTYNGEMWDMIASCTFTVSKLSP